MIECPKCHFVQPDDEYCASCGVNMKAYSRKHQAAQKWKNFAPYAITFCLVGALIGFFILQFRQPKKIDTPVVASLQKSTTAPVATKPDIKPVAQTTVPADDKNDDSAADDEVADTAAPIVEDKKEEKFTIEAIEVYFLEISKPLLTQLIQEGTVLNDSGTGMAFWIPDTKSTALQKGRIVTDQNFRQVNPSETTPLKILYQGGIKKDDEILFQMQISPKTVDEKRIRLHVNGAMKWLVDDGEAKSSTSSSFDSTYSITGDGQLILTGVIPQGKKPSKETREVLDKTPLGILNSETFHGKTSELMIVIFVR